MEPFFLLVSFQEIYQDNSNYLIKLSFICKGEIICFLLTMNESRSRENQKMALSQNLKINMAIFLNI